MTNWQKMGDMAKPTVKVLNEQPKAGKSDLKAPDLAKNYRKRCSGKLLGLVHTQATREGLGTCNLCTVVGVC